MTTERNSNIELIRIVAMVFIVIGHILGHGFRWNMPFTENIYQFVLVGVNLFVLISGYFGINFKWKSIVNLILLVSFYSLISFIFSILFFDEDIQLIKIANIFLPISHNGYYWFIADYAFLFLLSPIITTALKSMTDKQFMVIFGVLTYINCISGWFFNNDINMNGYNTMHLIYIYIVGHFICRFNIPQKMKKYYWLIIYILVSIITPYLFQGHPSKIVRYNNPFVIMAAISIFCFFSKFKFKNKAINFIASCTLPIYLIQDGMLGQHIYRLQYSFWTEYSDNIVVLLGFIMASVLGFFVISILLEPMRREIMKPIVDKITQIFDKLGLDVFTNSSRRVI